MRFKYFWTPGFSAILFRYHHQLTDHHYVRHTVLPHFYIKEFIQWKHEKYFNWPMGSQNRDKTPNSIICWQTYIKFNDGTFYEGREVEEANYFSQFSLTLPELIKSSKTFEPHFEALTWWTKMMKIWWTWWRNNEHDVLSRLSSKY